MKKTGILCLLLCILSCFFAANLHALDGFFAGLGAEANANTREGISAGGNAAFGVDLNPQFALGIKAVYSNNFDILSCLETAAFFRWYPFAGLFVQAEAGGSFFFEEGETYPAFLGGLTAGWRFIFGERFYLEPFARGGYPFAWGAGISAGIIFPKTLRRDLAEHRYENSLSYSEFSLIKTINDIKKLKISASPRLCEKNCE